MHPLKSSACSSLITIAIVLVPLKFTLRRLVTVITVLVALKVYLKTVSLLIVLIVTVAENITFKG